MIDDEQQLAALLDALPGRYEARFWRDLKEAAGMYRIRSTMSSAVRDAEDGDFEPLAELVLEACGNDARHEAVTAVLAGHLGGTLQARGWVVDALAIAGRITRANADAPLESLAEKW
ncbi:hypothetical protein [Streptomyces katrae]|uniref:hypothetical protein n=1 Tax=Streptomyces katrae TaxID=68223 RepID=UPI0004BE513E|nr:hypothetical protein [Streptomyces katrae]